MKTIYEFEKGDAITRIKPAKPMKSMFGEIADRGYMGNKLILLGIANGQIYLRNEESKDSLFDKKDVNLPIDLFDEGWDNYVELDEINRGNIFKIDKSVIQEQINKATDSENFELAKRLKNKFGQ